MLKIILCTLFSLATWASSPQPDPVCRDKRCEFQVDPQSKETWRLKVTFRSDGPEAKMIKKIEVLKDSKTLQELALGVLGNMSLQEKAQLFFVDLNGDQKRDIKLIANRAVNTYYTYWIFDVKTKRYVRVGDYTDLVQGKQKGQFTSIVKDGANTFKHFYELRDNKLILREKRLVN